MKNSQRSSDESSGSRLVPVEGGRPLTEGVPLAAVIPRKFRKDRTLMLLESPHDPVSERFRKLRSKIETLEMEATGHDPRAILLTSALPDEGKTTTALNLALAFAEDRDRRAVLVDLDLRRPSIGKYLVPEPQLGVSEVLDKGVGLEHALIHVKDTEMTVLPAGSPTPNPTGILRSGAIGKLLSELRQRFHWVLIDSPPCVPFADAAAIQEHVDGTILVVRAKHTAKATVVRALEAIEAGPLLGVVLNDVEQTVVDKYYYRYDAYDPYRYSSEEEKHP